MPRLRSPRGTACGRAGAALLLAASILCLAAPAASASSPLVVAPAEIAASTSVSVRVHGVASAGGLRVVLADASVSSSPVTVASAVAAAANGDAQTLVLDVPASVDATKDDYEFRLFRASAADASTPLARHDVRVFASLASLSGATRGDDGQDTRSKRALILETDKPQYKPGQTVRARALAIDALSLRPVAGAATFTFRDPNGFVAMRVTAEADAFGVASASLPTSAEPTLGDWAVEASFAETGNDATSIDARAALFVLEKYVLPTFEVAVAVESPSVFRGLDTVRGKVSATYTHGARVAGTADVAVWQKSSGGGGGGEMPMFADMMMIEDEPLPNAEERGGSSGSDTYRLLKRFPSMALDDSAEDGETPFELDLSDASPAVDYGWGGWGGGGAPALLVEATARDASTGETQTGTASVTPRYRALEVSISGPSLFKPGIDAELILRAESRDGAPAVGAFAATTTFFKSDGGSSSPIASAIELTERDAGVKRFYVRVPLNDAACCRVTDLSSYRSGSCCLNGASVELDRDAPSLRAVVNGVAAGAGDVPDFAPYASWYGQMAPPVGVLDAFVSIHGVPLDRVAVGTVVTATVESSFDPPGGAFDWAAVAPGRGVTHSGSVARGGTLSFAATEAMRRDATLVAYVAHDGSGGEAANVVACAKKIGVTFAADAAAGFGLPETLALTLDASEVAPGDAVRLTATSSAPGSRVFVLAHDVSVLIQSGGRQSAMSASKILEAASAGGGAGADAGTPFDSTTMAASSCWPPADVDASELVLLTAMKVSSCDPSDRMMMFDDAAMADAGVPEIALRGDAAAQESSTADDGVFGTVGRRRRRYHRGTNAALLPRDVGLGKPRRRPLDGRRRA
jgi:CD109 antigen